MWKIHFIHLCCAINNETCILISNSSPDFMTHSSSCFIGHTQLPCNIGCWYAMLCVYSSKDEIKPRCHLGLWLIKNGSIKNTKCLVTVQTSYSSQIRSIQTRRSTPDAFHYFQLRYIFQTIVFILKYAIEFISIHFFLHTSTCGDNFQIKNKTNTWSLGSGKVG